MKDPYDRNMFAASAAEMVVDASPANRVLLVGRLDKDRRLPGILDQFQINTDDVINICAETLYRKGLLEDAVMMYDLARNHEKVLSLMCTLLTQVVSQKGAPGSLRARLQVTAMDISTRYVIYTGSIKYSSNYKFINYKSNFQIIHLDYKLNANFKFIIYNFYKSFQIQGYCNPSAFGSSVFILYLKRSYGFLRSISQRAISERA